MKNLLKTITKDLSKNSPGILAGLGIVGMFSAIGMAIHATPKAVTMLEEEAEKQGVERTDLSPADTVKTTWKYYIPTVATAVLSAVLIFEGYSITKKRHAALAAAYGLSEAALKEFQDKLVETDGEKKLDTMRKAIVKDKMEKRSIESTVIEDTGKGNTRCYEPLNGKQFYSDIEAIRRAVNATNSYLVREGVITLNDFYDELGLDRTVTGTQLGWSFQRDDLIDIGFTSTLLSDGTPCLALVYRNPPTYDYDRY